MLKKLFIALFLSLFLIGSANAVTLVWDAYQYQADGFKIETSTDQTNWTVEVNNIPVTAVASDIPQGPDNTRVYYRMKAFGPIDGEVKDSPPSNVVSFYWTTGGGGFEGVAPVDNIHFLDCDTILLDDTHLDYSTCVNRHTLTP